MPLAAVPVRRKACSVQTPSDQVPRRAAAAVASHIDAVLNALEVVFDDLDAGGCRQEVDGSTLVEAGGRALKPLLCLGA